MRRRGSSRGCRARQTRRLGRPPRRRLIRSISFSGLMSVEPAFGLRSGYRTVERSRGSGSSNTSILEQLGVLDIV